MSGLSDVEMGHLSGRPDLQLAMANAHIEMLRSALKNLLKADAEGTHNEWIKAVLEAGEILEGGW